MSDAYKAEWVVLVLNDIAAFLTANGVHDGARAVACAASVVVQEGESANRALSQFKQHVTAPIADGNVVRFSVTSRTSRTSL
jgi:hypothetical protein